MVDKQRQTDGQAEINLRQDNFSYVVFGLVNERKHLSQAINKILFTFSRVHVPEEPQLSENWPVPHECGLFFFFFLQVCRHMSDENSDKV